MVFLFAATSTLVDNLFVVAASRVVLSDAVSFHEQIDMLESVSAWRTLKDQFNQRPEASVHRLWIDAVENLEIKLGLTDVRLWMSTHEIHAQTETAIQQGKNSDADSMLATILDRDVHYIPAYYSWSQMRQADTLELHTIERRLTELSPRYELLQPTNDSLHLVGYDLAETELSLGVSILDITLYWISSTDLTAPNSGVAICHQNELWTWYCLGHHAWAVGTARNLLDDGTFELSPVSKIGLPHGYRETYRRAQTTVSMETESSSNGSFNKVCLKSSSISSVSLGSQSIFVVPDGLYLLAAKIRADEQITPKIGLYWRIGNGNAVYQYVPNVRNNPNAWSVVAGVLRAPRDAHEGQLRFLYRDSVGETCADYFVLIQLPSF